jgi:outer membrane protein OmpA-like peptidoglycan-associated protein
MMNYRSERADAVKDYLVRELGVSPDRRQTVGKGFSEPTDPRHPYALQKIDELSWRIPELPDRRPAC